MKEKLPTLKHGSFAENIVTRGIDLSSLHIGDQIQIGQSVILEITQIGKECHNSGCAIKKLTGDCIMPREGIFGKVITGGTIKARNLIVPIRLTFHQDRLNILKNPVDSLPRNKSRADLLLE